MRAKIGWNEIEAVYVTSAASYRDIAKKYGICLKSVENHGKQGKWVEKRQAYREDVMEKMLTAGKAQAAERTARLLEAGDGLLDKVRELTEKTDSPAALKTLTEALKNIRDAQMLKEGSKAEGDKITVVLDGVREFVS